MWHLTMVNIGDVEVVPVHFVYILVLVELCQCLLRAGLVATLRCDDLIVVKIVINYLNCLAKGLGFGRVVMKQLEVHVQATSF